MPEHDPRRIAAWAIGALLLVALAIWYASRSHGGSAAAASGPPPAISIGREGGGRVVVDVSGAVRRPGVYRLSGSARVEDALRRAGGATHRADLAQINRAQKLEDGRQVLVPVRTPAASAAAGEPGTSATTAPGPPLNLNTATLEQLDELDGVGPATAQKILDFRKAHGGFNSVEDLGQVPGIGDKRLAALRDKVRV